MNIIKRFEDLEAWQNATEIVIKTFEKLEKKKTINKIFQFLIF